MANLIFTESKWRSQLPHWEVRGAWHFITIRCAGSLPKTAQDRIREIRDQLEAIDPNSPDFSQLQRQYFLTAEKYLDAGSGFAPFTTPVLCRTTITAMQKTETEGWHVGDGVLMPNHVHLLMRKKSDSGLDLKSAVQRMKGRSARSANIALNRTGRFWQEDWFDRWMRDESEYERTRSYIENNPVKAHLCESGKTYFGYFGNNTNETEA